MKYISDYVLYNPKHETAVQFLTQRVHDEQIAFIKYVWRGVYIVFVGRCVYSPRGYAFVYVCSYFFFKNNTDNMRRWR